MRLSHSHQRTNNAWDVHGGDNAPLGHHYSRHREGVVGVPQETHSYQSPSKSQASPRVIAAPQPLSASNVENIELLVSRDERLLLKAVLLPTEERNRDLLSASLGVLRSDSLLARVFPNSTTHTVDGHASSDNRSNPTSSQDTLSTGLMFPPAMSSSSVDPTPIRGIRAEPFSAPVLSSPAAFRSGAHAPSPPLPRPHPRDTKPQQAHPPSRRGYPRPDIVLPAPLGPAQHPHESSRYETSPTQDGYTASPQRELPQPLSPPQTSREGGSSRARHTETHGNNRRHSAQFEPTLVRHQRATKRKSVPVEARFPTASRDESMSPRSPLQAGDNEVSPTWRSTMLDPHRIPSSPTEISSASRLMTPPSVSPPSRTLRHARDDISKTRRPWS